MIGEIKHLSRRFGGQQRAVTDPVMMYMGSAQKMVSKAMTILSSGSVERESLLGSDIGDDVLSDERREEILAWVLEREVVEKNNDDEDMSNSDNGPTTPLPARREFAERFWELSTASNVDLDLRLIQSLFPKAEAAMVTGKYEDAREILKMIRKRSVEKFGPQYEWRKKTAQMLGAIYDYCADWEELEAILEEQLQEQFEGRERVALSSTLHSLGRTFLKLKDTRKAEGWCRAAIEARRGIFGDTSILFYQSIDLLVEILQAAGENVEANGFNDMLPKKAQEGKVPPRGTTNVRVS